MMKFAMINVVLYSTGFYMVFSHPNWYWWEAMILAIVMFGLNASGKVEGSGLC